MSASRLRQSRLVRRTGFEHLALASASGLLTLGLLTPEAGATRVNTGNQPAEPNDHVSFVRGYNGNQLDIVATDKRYTNDIRNNLLTSSVDIVMQQCHGGGFVDNVDGTAFRGPVGGVNKSFTIATAANWNETAKNAEALIPGGVNEPIKKYVDNFTRAWVENPTKFPNDSMNAHFTTAATGWAGNNPIARDPFAPGGANQTNALVEHPQYSSTNAAADGRKILNAGGTSKQYAILVAWDAPELRHDVNIQRTYNMLRNTYGVPVDNIVVLDGNRPRTTNGNNATYIQPAYPAFYPSLTQQPGGDALPSVFNDGPNSQANWLAAVKGDLFTGAKPGANDRMLIYNTGHGGDGTYVDGKVVIDVGNNKKVKIPFADQFSVESTATGTFNEDSNSGVSWRSTPIPQGQFLFQVSTSVPIPDNVGLSLSADSPGAPEVELISSSGSGPRWSDALASSSDRLANSMLLDELAPGMQENYFYQFSLTRSQMQLLDDAPDLAVNFSSLSMDGVLSSFNFVGGDQEYVAVVPEPTTAGAAALVSSATLLQRRRRRPR